LRVESADRKAITAYDEILASAGAVLASTRADLVSDLSPLAEQAFAEVSGEGVGLGVTYRPRVPPDVGAIREALARSLEKDLARGFTAEGPHADDLELRVQESRARHHASQGQQRAIVLALKIAELDVLARRAGRVPILLLDDVSSELDRRRNERLFERIARMGGQVFLTTTHPEFIRLSHDRVDFQVEAGRVLSTG
jgi:DNA replication and repair protein RecF